MSIPSPTAATAPAVTRVEEQPPIPATADALDLHEEISHPGPCAGCQRWPEHLRLTGVHGGTGEAVVRRGRCGATNLCAYCARIAAVENSECLAIDAMRSGGPSVWMVLTTRSASKESAPFYKSREVVMRAIKRRWPQAEYAALVEFTTGYGPRAHGARRPHWNVMLKGVPVSDLEQLRDVVTSVWCAREDARPAAQHVGAVSESGGLMRYLALHFQKESQAPPAGWTGHRFLRSRGYFDAPMSEVRAEAREALQKRRDAWRVARDVAAAGGEPDAQEVHDATERLAEERKRTTWVLTQVQPLTGTASAWVPLIERQKFRRAVTSGGPAVRQLWREASCGASAARLMDPV